MKTGTLLASVLVVGSAVGHMATPSAVTACYEGGGPAEGYVHKETNLDFTVDRSSEKSVAFTESYNKFEGVSCSAVPAHKFGETAWCNTNGALCNRECPMSMPQKCADVDSFGVCTPTVKDICDTLQGSRDSCTSSSDAAQAKADDYLTVDVRASPCDGDEQSSTLNALKAYKVAYNNWATAFNNASQVCKVGETIRDYNGQSFMALHKNVDQVAKAAAAVCSEDDFNAEGSLPNLGSSEKNKAICEKMNNDLAKLSEDSQTSSKQIQCFSSKCQELSGKEATAFADMKAKFETFQANYDKYFAAAEGFNAKVEDKNAKLAAVQAAHVQLAEVKAATGAKFTKDYEVYHKFETGAANGNCGLTACEMESVCGYDIEADASAYVEKDANGKCRGKTVDLVEHCYAEVADDKAKAAAEAAAKAAAEKAAAEKAAAEKAAAEAAANAAAEKAAAEKAAAEAAANASPLEKCKSACGAKNMMCNDDISVSSHRELSCLQACHAVTVAGINEQTCMATCNTRGPEFKIGEFTYPAGKSCADRYNAGIAPRRQDNCEAGCAAGVQIAAASPAPAAPQIQRTRVGEFVGDNTRALKDAINNCRGKFDTDPNCKINTWDVSKMTSLDWVFGDNTWFNENIGDWDVSNVRSFSHTFISAKSFSRCEISKWNVRAEGSMRARSTTVRSSTATSTTGMSARLTTSFRSSGTPPISIENTASWYDQTPVFGETCKSYGQPGGCPGNLNGRST